MSEVEFVQSVLKRLDFHFQLSDEPIDFHLAKLGDVLDLITRFW